MNHRVSLIIGVLCLSFLEPHSGWSADPPKLEKLVIGYPAPVASLGIIEVMRKAGLFKKNGLDVDLVYIQGSPILTTAMVSGQVPLSFLGGAARRWLPPPSAVLTRFILLAASTRFIGASSRHPM